MNRVFLLAVFLLLFALQATAQTNTPTYPTTRKPKPRPESSVIKDDFPQESNLPEEMRIRMAIERADNEHRKVMTDVDKLNELSTEVAKVFQDSGKLSGEEVKKLSTIEKLAKRVLSHAGGDEVDDKTGRIAQMSVGDAITGISEAAAVIKKTMDAGTRHIVSATVIGNSNDIINMAQLVRRAQKSN
jgi:hypothetical protein